MKSIPFTLALTVSTSVLAWPAAADAPAHWGCKGGRTDARVHWAAGLVDRYVVYVAPLLFGGDDGRALFAGPGAPTLSDVWRGRIVDVRRLGDDLRLDLEGR